jgi:PERQ amino acid-rich with GYF domain-containing protein
MTTVRTKKSRKGKKLNIVPDVFDDQPSGNDSSGLETTQPEGQSSMTNEVPLSSIMPSSTAAGAKAAPWAATPLGQESGSGTSLRAIQEAEERRARVNRQLRQQQASIVTSGANSSQTPVSMSWGLAMPSSRDQTSAQQSQSASQTGGTPSGPVWNSASQAPKKTLAEIQQEEERRQRALQAATANANAANDLASSAQSMSASSMPSRIRGYADSANRAQAQSTSSVQSSVTTPPASGWSLVGASGKPTTGSPASAPLTQSSAPTVRSVSVPQKSESVVKTNSVYDSGNGKAPSSEFLQYCREQLRGLNNMKADDFIEMLLSFPIDATSDVVEIIAESVYAASSTLDGRRFAADFVAKRKQDAQGAFKSVSNGLHTDKISGQPSASNGFNYSASSRLTGARSASDVLQSQPKTTNENFGGFKVVKAKGGKKRA